MGRLVRHLALALVLSCAACAREPVRSRAAARTPAPTPRPAKAPPAVRAEADPPPDWTCLAPDCEPPRGSAREVAELGYSALRDDSEEAACLSLAAARLAEEGGEVAVAGAAYYNLGRALEAMGCPQQASRAYRASLCRRPDTPQRPETARTVVEACQELRRGDCDEPCVDTTFAPAPLGSFAMGDAGTLAVSPGDRVAGPLPAAVCVYGSRFRCEEVDRREIVIGGAATIVVLLRLIDEIPAGSGAAVVLQRQAGDLVVLGTYVSISGYEPEIRISREWRRPDGSEVFLELSSNVSYLDADRSSEAATDVLRLRHGEAALVR